MGCRLRNRTSPKSKADQGHVRFESKADLRPPVFTSPQYRIFGEGSSCASFVPPKSGQSILLNHFVSALLKQHWLSTKRSPTGSETTVKTMGIVRVCLR